MQTECQRLSDFMKVQMDIIRKHLDEHKYLRKIEKTDDALHSFIHDYGWVIRELYCSHICSDKLECKIAIDIRKEGDLLRNHLTSVKK